MAEIRNLLDMGQYASYLWTGWGLSALGLLVMIVAVAAERRRAKARLKRAQERGTAA